MPLADLTMEHYDRIMDVNLRGVVLRTKHALRTMVPSGGGVILNWSSTGGLNGSRLPITAYSASKAGVIAVTQASGDRVRHQGHPRDRSLPRLCRDANVRRTGGR